LRILAAVSLIKVINDDNGNWRLRES
jgi:hypothetical protein